MASLEDIDEEFLSDEEALDLEPTLKNLIDQKSLQWIFVGGKGGVGKTTISSCLAIQLAKHRESVLIISTDPAHNLSDAFNQKFSDEPTKVTGFENLYAMEIDPTIESEDFLSDFMPESTATGGLKNMIKEVGSSLPGMDEISSFMEIMKQVKSMKFSVVVFDTAPTGHTLRLLSFPSMLEKGVGKMMNMQNMGGLFSQVTQMLGGSGEEDMQEKIAQSKNLIEVISNQFKDPNKTTFVCVCIPEFLSVYETERLVQELTKSGIDTHNIVVNQLVFQPENCECKICQSRMKIQKKYLNQVFELYDAFHVVQMPLLGEEVRGPKALLSFGENLMTPYPMAHKKEDLAKLNPTAPSSATTTTKQ